MSRVAASRTQRKPLPALPQRHLSHRYQNRPMAQISHDLRLYNPRSLHPLLPKYPSRKAVGWFPFFLPEMELLGAPLDALVFLYSAAVAGSIWASLAVLAISIAIGLWRIRALRFISSVPPPPLDPTGAGAGCAPGQAPAEPSPPGHADGNTTPKARFTTYFDADDGSDDNERGDGEETEEEEEAPWGWERRIVTKRGDLGRRRYQYRTAFNDSAVRMRQGRVELTVTAGRLRLPEEGHNGN